MAIRLAFLFLMISFGSASILANAGEPIATNDPEVVVEPLAQDLPLVTSLAFAPNGELFFLEKNTGRVRTLDLSTGVASEPLAQVAPVVVGLEAGAIGLEFDPEIDPDGTMKAYVSFVASATTWRISTFEIDRFGVPSEVSTVIDFPDCAPGLGFFDEAIHNIENIHFGPNPVAATPEKVLFVSIGDGGIPIPVDPDRVNPALSTDNWCGGIYFFDPNNPPALEEAPSHNYCLGVRNAFDFDFHPLSGTLYFTENGFTDFDEINQGRFGDHFGWNESVGPNENPSFVDPIYTREIPTFAPTGICIYTGDRLPPRYKHQILFGTYNQGEIHLMRLEDPAQPRFPVGSMEAILASEDGLSRPLGSNEGIIALTEGPDGWVYFSTGGNSLGDSSIYRLRTPPEDDFAGFHLY